jgi:hypothetical protein
MIYELLAGRRPCMGESKVETMTAILKSDPAALAHNVPRSWEGPSGPVSDG